jgi:hypothetical protein
VRAAAWLAEARLHAGVRTLWHDRKRSLNDGQIPNPSARL